MGSLIWASAQPIAAAAAILMGGFPSPDYNWGNGIALDSVGDAYITGTTNAANFPTKKPFQPFPGGRPPTRVFGAPNDAFVCKLVPASVAEATSQSGTNAETVASVPIVILKAPPVQYVSDETKGRATSLKGIFNYWGGAPGYIPMRGAFYAARYTENGFFVRYFTLPDSALGSHQGPIRATVSGIINERWGTNHLLIPKTITFGSEIAPEKFTEEARLGCESATQMAWPPLSAIAPDRLSKLSGFKASPHRPPSLAIEMWDVERGLVLLRGATLQHLNLPWRPHALLGEKINYDIVYDVQRKAVRAFWVYLEKDMDPPD